MKLPLCSLLAVTSCLLAAACEDDKGPTGTTGGMDAPADQAGPIDAADAGSPDLSDTSPVVDAGGGVDCPAIGCRDQAVFNIPGYLTRFGDSGRNIDVTACLGSTCGSVRAEGLGQSATLSARTGLTTSVELASSGWLTVFVRGSAPPDAQLAVQLRIVTTGGQQLINYMGPATGEEHCPNGAGCGRCQALIVDIDPADAGVPADSGDPRAGHCPK